MHVGWWDIFCFGFVTALIPIFIHKWLRMALDFWSFSGWRPVEATLEALSIEKVGGKGPFRADNRNVKVRFTYLYGNAQFQGNSVAIPDLVPFPLLQYSPRIYAPLQEIFQTTKQIQGWVDPDHPERAVLRAVAPWPYVLGGAAMAVCFTLMGYYLGVMALPKADVPKIGVVALALYLLILYWSYRFKRTSF